MKTRAGWPELTYTEHKDAAATLQLWTQIAGKIRLAHTPWLNHQWHVPLYVTVVGLGTGLIPYGERSFQIDFDFTRHRLVVTTTAGEREEVELRPRTVADFYDAVRHALERLHLNIAINELPNEVQDPIPFSADTVHRAYSPEYAHRLWMALVQVDRVFHTFRTGFVGKASPVHFFGGASISR